MDTIAQPRVVPDCVETRFPESDLLDLLGLGTHRNEALLLMEALLASCAMHAEPWHAAAVAQPPR
jgi:hypothetical protein